MPLGHEVLFRDIITRIGGLRNRDDRTGIMMIPLEEENISNPRSQTPSQISNIRLDGFRYESKNNIAKSTKSSYTSDSVIIFRDEIEKKYPIGTFLFILKELN